MAYVIDRLVRATAFSSMQPVERVGAETQKRLAIGRARFFAQRQNGDAWIQVRNGSGVIIATFKSGRLGAEKV